MSWLKKFIRLVEVYFKRESVDLLKEEEKNLTILFDLLLFSPLVGIPLLPPILSLELLPYFIEEAERLVERERDYDDFFSRIAAVLEPT